MSDYRSEASAVRGPVAVSSPGGVARQYRVQYLASSEAAWRLYANFTRREQAEACLGTLRQRGIPSRLVTYQICATAV